MEKKLIVEIEKIKRNMGLITEISQFPPSMLDDIVIAGGKILKKFSFGNSRVSSIIRSDLDDLSKITRGQISATADDIADILNRLISTSDDFSKMILPKLAENMDTGSKNWIKNIKSAIISQRSLGRTQSDVAQQADAMVINAMRRSLIPELTTYLRDDIAKYIDDIYHPFTSTSKDIIGKGGEIVKKGLEKNWSKFLEGFKEGWSAKSGTGLAWKATKNWWRNRFMNEYQKKLGQKYRLTDEERKVLGNFIKWAPADIPSIQSSAEKFGFGGLTGNLTMQLIKKFVTLWFIKIVWLMFWGWVRDQKKKGTEYDQYSDAAILQYRFFQAVKDLPSFGLISPGIWLLGAILVPFIKSQKGADGSWAKEFKEYIFGDDELKIPAPPRRVQRAIDALNGDSLRAEIDTAVADIDTLINDIQSGNNPDTSGIIPDSATTVPQSTLDSLASDWNSPQ
jgi:hypothetical protein